MYLVLFIYLSVILSVHSSIYQTIRWMIDTYFHYLFTKQLSNENMYLFIFQSCNLYLYLPTYLSICKFRLSTYSSTYLPAHRFIHSSINIIHFNFPSSTSHFFLWVGLKTMVSHLIHTGHGWIINRCLTCKCEADGIISSTRTSLLTLVFPSPIYCIF